MSLKRRVEVLTRRLYGTPYTVYELVVDGQIAKSQISPFDQADLEAAARIGRPIEPLVAPSLRPAPPRRRRTRAARRRFRMIRPSTPTTNGEGA